MKVDDTVRFGRIPFRVTRMNVPGMRQGTNNLDELNTDEESDDGPGACVPSILEKKEL